MSPIANYNLGSVQGEVKITYDGKGVKEAKEDVRDYKDELGSADDAHEKFASGQKKASDSSKGFSKEVNAAIGSVDKFAGVLGKIATVAVLSGATQSVVGFAGAVAPLIGLVGVLPGVLGTVAAVAGTVKIGMTGMGDAMSAVAEGDAAALDEALKKLAPSAREVVLEVNRMKPAWDELRMDVQQRLFDGMGQVVNQLGSTYLPVLRQGLGQVATELNTVGKLSAVALMQPSTVASLNILLANSAETTKTFGGALGDVLAGFINIAAVGSEWLPIWTNGVDGLAQRFREWTESAEGQAQINEWISQGADVLGKLVQIITNLGRIAQGVFQAMNTGSGGILENLIQLTEQAAAWVNSAEGQRILVSIFQSLHTIMLAVVDAIKFLAPIIGELAAQFNSLPQPVQSMIASFIVWGAILGKVAVGIAGLINALRPLAPVFTFIFGLIGKIGGYLGTALSWVWRFIGGWSGLARVGQIILRFLGPVGWIIAAVIALATAIIMNWETVKQWTITAWTAITTALTTAWTWIQTTATTVWTAIVTFFSTIWNTVVTIWTTVWTSISTTVMTIWNGIVVFFQTVWNIIVGIFQFVAGVLLAVVFTIFQPIWDMIMVGWNNLVAFLSFIWNGIVSLATTLWGLVSSAIMTVWNAIWGFLQPIIQTIWDAIVASWNAISSTASSVWNAILSVIQTVWNAIWGFISPILQTISNAITSAWNAVSSFASSVWNAVASTVSSVWNRIYTTISDLLGRAWQTIVDFGNRIKGLAGEAMNWLYNAGRNIVQGLWNGIASLGSWLYNQIMGWVRSVVPGPVLQFLGIASPSKYMKDEVGKQIPAGIAAGIEANSAVASQASAAMAANVGNAAMLAAAEEVLAARKAGIAIFEDLSFKGMSKNLGAQNDALLNMFDAAGKPGGDIFKFLQDFLASARTGVTGKATTVSTAPTPVKAAVNSLAATAPTTPEATAATGTAVAAATTPASASPTVINIGTFALSVEGNLDPTDPVRWRSAIEKIRESLTTVEASYR